MIRAIILSLALAFAPGIPALALSCVEPDVALTFQSAAKSEQQYVVLYGAFDFPAMAGETRAFDRQAEPSEVSVMANFSGKGLTKDGFLPTTISEVLIAQECFGPWCGGMGPGKTILAFVEKGEAGYTLRADPCQWWTFHDPTRRALDAIEACFRGENCQASTKIR